MSVDLKTLTPDTTINDSAILFGADSQASTTPSVYSVATLRTHIVGTANTFTQPQVVSVSSSSDALRITQTGAGNALVVEDSANPDASPFVVNTDGRVLAGATASYTGVFNAAFLQAHAVGGNGAIDTLRYSADVFGPDMGFLKSRSATTGTQAIVLSGDTIGSMRFGGSDGVAFIQAATISAQVDGTPGTNDMPGRLVFSTTADGASTPLERMRITNTGNVGIGTSSPSTPLTVKARSADNIAVRLLASPGNVGGILQFTDDPVTTEYGSLIGTSTYLLANSSTNLLFQTSSIERMRITSAGNVGIGTTSPDINLRVAGTFAQIGTIDGTVDNRFVSTSGGGAGILGTFSNHSLAIFSNATERMRVDTSGNLLLGTTSSPTTGTQSLTVETGTAPTATPADTISLYSTDLSAGNTILSLFTEGTPVNANTTAAATHRIAVRINGTVYYLLANTAA